MKKIYMGLIIGILLIGSISALAVFENRQDALNYLKNVLKPQRESDMNKVTSTITYLSDKECVLDYYSEKSICYVCIRYNYIINQQTTKITEDCINIPQDKTIQEDDKFVKDYVISMFDIDFPPDEIKYTETEMLNRKIDLEIK